MRYVERLDPDMRTPMQELERENMELREDCHVLDGKQSAYHEVAEEMLDYIRTCNKHNIVPLRWDANIFGAKIHDIERRAR